MSLHIEQVSKSFGEKHILDTISFTVEKGEFVSVIGPSGSGKSTLFSIIGGILAPDSGDVFIDNKAVTNKGGHISYMPQQAALFPWRTVLKNVLLGQELQGKQETDRAVDMLHKAGLADVIHAYPHELSGGMKQRVAFIRALLSDQDFMCLDEPFSALDDFTRLDMQKWLLETWEAYDRSILFITHNVDEAIFLSDKVIILSTNPAEIKDIIEIPFARPREEQILLSPAFTTLKQQIVKVVRS